MKNSTILKDELRILRPDKSAVVTELRRASKELKDIYAQILDEEAHLEVVRNEANNETARLTDLRSRVVFVNKELGTLRQDLKNLQNSYDVSRTRNSQEEKLHLGRIKELEDEERNTTKRISELKALYDKNSDVYARLLSEKTAHIRGLDIELNGKTKQLSRVSSELTKREEEEKKLTKDRLKREDKIRIREKALDQKEVMLTKKEEDLITMSKDIMIVYGRLKEIYAQVRPDVNLDKIILQAL